MATVELTNDTFKETITDNDIVIVDFWAPWCGPCKSFAPTYEAVSEKHEDVVFAKVNTEDEQQLAASFQIRSIPSLLLFHLFSNLIHIQRFRFFYYFFQRRTRQGTCL